MIRLQVAALLFATSFAAVLDVRDCGAVAGSLAHNITNAAAIKRCFVNATAGDTVLIPAGLTFHAVGGIAATKLKGVTLQIEGTLAAVPDFVNWPCPDGHKFLDLVSCEDCSDLTVTGNGTIDGQGVRWWNKWVEGGIKGKHRPHLLVLNTCINIVVEGIRLINSPNFHIRLNNVAEAEVRFVTIDVNRKAIRSVKQQMRLQKQRQIQSTTAAAAAAVVAGGGRDSPLLQPEDLNTDGIDPSGRDIWIHDCYINNDDDSIAVKPCTKKTCSLSACSSNMLIENMVLTGFGASIGSVPADVVDADDTHNCVRNITFRNISMPSTGKGIYIKNNPGCDRPGAYASIADILYENVTITNPKMWAIWIGPQQQHQPFHPLGEDCALDYPLSPHCPTQGCVDFRNITLRHITIIDPVLSPGVMLGNASNPMDVIFDGVVTKWSEGVVPPIPYGKHYHCEHTHMTLAPNSTNSPIPNC